MRILTITALAAAALLSIGATRPVRGNWGATTTVTPSGSHILGNPAAAIKLAEYVSYTCSHCAHFEREADAPLRLTYIAPGKVSVEVRHVVRDPVDLTAALLTNCGVPARFFQNHAAILRSQDRWISIMGSASKAQQARWSSGAMPARMRAIATDFGFYTIMERRGYRRTELDRCLSDEAMARRLIAQGEEGERLGVEGTPSFMINEVLLAGTHTWQSLDTQLRARM